MRVLYVCVLYLLQNALPNESRAYTWALKEANVHGRIMKGNIACIHGWLEQLPAALPILRLTVFQAAQTRGTDLFSSHTHTLTLWVQWVSVASCYYYIYCHFFFFEFMLFCSISDCCIYLVWFFICDLVFGVWKVISIPFAFMSNITKKKYFFFFDVVTMCHTAYQSRWDYGRLFIACVLFH